MNLEETINNLYTVFSQYIVEGNLRVRSCDCCVSDNEIRLLLSKPLKELTAEDIYHFMTSAVTTYGAVKDYKHFLPRILELMIYQNDVVDDFFIYEKLNYCQWLSWNIEEVKAIKLFFENLLIDALSKDSDNVNDFIYINHCISLNLKYNDFERLSKILLKTDSKIFIKSVIYTIVDDYYEKVDVRLTNLYSSEKILKKIEELFFETKDKYRASKISIAYSILENER